MHKLGALIFLFAGLLVDAQTWQNRYDQPLHFTCGSRDSISMITSKHSNDAEDRVWGFSCQKTFDTQSECFWTNYVNYFDEQFTFNCPPNHVISGMDSFHNNDAEDRRWKFYCCRVNNYCNSHCQWTTYVNNFDEYFTWYVPGMNYLVGAQSYHDNGAEDRRWKYLYCIRKNC
ncbi:hemagglutinin/amebocyte aggregation factor-like [Megalops cyprinoides]|uniref:hemagglutinin/amebocyte aggregation factor-like n=1 Tax=Megalops cyprinoides TaxID=118141 RepID=UPI001864C818|nr:hemagglutinin/amebocyte aggregation factor-like [Megalops cyprinoides]